MIATLNVQSQNDRAWHFFGPPDFGFLFQTTRGRDLEAVVSHHGFDFNSRGFRVPRVKRGER